MAHILEIMAVSLTLLLYVAYLEHSDIFSLLPSVTRIFLILHLTQETLAIKNICIAK